MSKDDSLSSLFDKQVKGIRQHRQKEVSAKAEKKIEYSHRWYEVVVEAKKLKEKLSTNPRILEFSISREMDEIRIKVEDAHRARGYGYFFLCRGHPDGKYPGHESAWLREVGRDDRNFPNPKEALEAMIIKLATMLA